MTNSNSSQPSLAILGCGWLGLPLARHMISKGWRVNGSTTSEGKLESLRAAGVQPFLISLTGNGVSGAFVPKFLDADALVLCVPPGGKSDPHVQTTYPQRVAALTRLIRRSPVARVIFTSSTSVYPDLNRTVAEDDAGDPPTASGRACLKVEELLRESPGYDTTVVRLGGLLGPDRHPVKFLAGRDGLDSPNAPVNLIHLDDAIGAIAALLERPRPGAIYNVCAPSHPSRREFYTCEAARLGLPAPRFTETPAPWKRVSSERLIKDLGFSFRHADLMALSADQPPS